MRACRAPLIAILIVPFGGCLVDVELTTTEDRADLAKRLEAGAGHREDEMAGLDHDLGSAVEGIEGHVECHDLGQRGRILPRIGIGRVENLATVRVDDDGSVACLARRAAKSGKQQERCYPD